MHNTSGRKGFKNELNRSLDMSKKANKFNP
jgi:hypothetical protein